MVPDGTRVKLNGVEWEIFNPKWYRLDRWFFFGLLFVTLCPRRMVGFTSIGRVYGQTQVVRREFRAFEV